MSLGTEQKNALHERSASAAPSGATAGLSIVVPAYNEAASLERIHARLVEVAQKLAATRALACEVIYVDDGSADDTLAIARALPASALDVQVVSLSRNFGKEAALLAGLDHARQGAPRRGVVFAARRGEGVLRAAQFRQPRPNPRERRRLPPAVAARRQGAAPDAGAQPLLQRAGELDRISPKAHRLRAGATRARPQPLGTALAD